MSATPGVIVGLGAYAVGVAVAFMVLAPWIRATLPAAQSGLPPASMFIVLHLPTILGAMVAGVIAGFALMPGPRTYLWALLPSVAFAVWFPTDGDLVMSESLGTILVWDLLPRFCAALSCFAAAVLVLAKRGGTNPRVSGPQTGANPHL